MEVVPTGEGPLIVRPSGDAGAAGVGQAAMGRSIQHLGSAITKKGMQAEQRTKQLQQDTQVSQYALEATQGWNDLQTELAAETDPDARQPKWEGFQTAQRGRLGEIPDEDVRQRAQTWLNEQTAVWDTAVTTGTWKLRLKQSYDHLQALDTDATARRDDSLVVPHLSAMVNAGHMAGGDANDYLKAKRRQIRGELGKDRIAAKVRDMDHPAAVDYLNDPKTFAGLDVDDQEKLDFKNALVGKLRVQAAAANQEAARVEAGRERNAVEALGEAWRRNLDFENRLGQMEAGALRPGDFKEAVTIAERGPAAENDVKTYAELLRLQDGLARGSVDPAAVRQYAMAHASKLKPATVQAAIRTAAETYSAQAQAVNEAVQRARQQFVTVTDSTLELLAAMGRPEAELKPAEDKRAFQYRLVSYLSDELDQYVRAHPEATREEIVKRGRQIETSLRQQTQTEQRATIGAWEEAAFTPGAATPWGEVPFPSSPGIPAGLEGLWPQLNDTEKQTVRELLAAGFSVERILEEARNAE